jgi:ABC-type glycerol-3-phosphate transport system substrate-binding protein
MHNKLLKAATAVAAVLVLTACSEAPKTTATDTKKTEIETKKEPPKPPEAVAAQTAFWEMYKPARTWAADLLVLSLASGEVPSVKSEGGKFPMWTAVFVSPSLREARTFSYSVVDDGAEIHKGVTVGGAQSWSGATPKSMPFQTTGFVVNSDAAYKTAFEKAEEWVKNHPDKKVAFLLGSASRFPAPVWFVVWGSTTSGYAVYVNATTGTAIGK